MEQIPITGGTFPSENFVPPSQHHGNELDDLWILIKDQAREILAHEEFDRWFADLVPLELNAQEFIIQTPRKIDALWITNHYLEILQSLVDLQKEKTTVKVVSP